MKAGLTPSHPIVTCYCAGLTLTPEAGFLSNDDGTKTLKSITCFQDSHPTEQKRAALLTQSGQTRHHAIITTVTKLTHTGQITSSTHEEIQIKLKGISLCLLKLCDPRGAARLSRTTNLLKNSVSLSCLSPTQPTLKKYSKKHLTPSAGQPKRSGVLLTAGGNFTFVTEKQPFLFVQ